MQSVPLTQWEVPVEGLGRRVAKCTKDRIYSCLVTGTLRLEPRKYVLIDSKRNERLRWCRLQSFADDAAHDVLNIGFRMFVRGRARC